MWMHLSHRHFFSTHCADNLHACSYNLTLTPSPDKNYQHKSNKHDEGLGSLWPLWYTTKPKWQCLVTAFKCRASNCKLNFTCFQLMMTTPQSFSFLDFWSRHPQTLPCSSHKPWIPCSSLKPMRLPESFKAGCLKLSPPTSGFQILNIDLRTFVGLSAFCEESSSGSSSKPSLLIVRFTKGLMLITPSWMTLTVLVLVIRVRMTKGMLIPFGLLWESAVLDIGDNGRVGEGTINLCADVGRKPPRLRECS